MRCNVQRCIATLNNAMHLEPNQQQLAAAGAATMRCNVHTTERAADSIGASLYLYLNLYLNLYLD
jgi:hypothetical protein